MYSRSSDGTLAPFVFGVPPKPIRGHYFRGREEYERTQRKEEDDHEQRFLKEAFDKTKYRSEERDLMTGKKEKTISGAMYSAPNLEHNLRTHIPPKLRRGAATFEYGIYR